ncbi:MAG: D-alanyl-D-alanine carboxypeptidase family protein [Carboxydocellales bacterium]
MKLIRIFLALVILLTPISRAVANQIIPTVDKPKLVISTPPPVVGNGVVLIDTNTGQILFAKNEHGRMYPASTTKILTALVALEQGKLGDKVKIDKEPTEAGGSSIWLKEGEEVTLEELIWSLLLNSANDAAVAIAKHIGGSVQGFTKMMNDKAKQLGAVESNFVNPHGLPNPDHYTTAHDLALIAKAAMGNPEFRKIVGSKVKDINRVPADALTRLINHNKLLWRYEGANGIKTGYTVQAQQCLVGSAKKDDQEFIAVVLGSTGGNIWGDVTKLLDFGFANFQTVKLIEGNMLVKTVTIQNAEIPVQALTARSLAFTVNQGVVLNPQSRVELTKNLQAPVPKGTVVGKLIYTSGGQELGQVELLAANNVEPKKFPVKKIVWVGGWALGLVYLFLLIRKAALRKERRKVRRTRLYGISD